VLMRYPLPGPGYETQTTINVTLVNTTGRVAEDLRARVHEAVAGPDPIRAMCGQVAVSGCLAA